MAHSRIRGRKLEYPLQALDPVAEAKDIQERPKSGQEAVSQHVLGM